MFGNFQILDGENWHSSFIHPQTLPFNTTFIAFQINELHFTQYIKNHHLLLGVFQKKVPNYFDTHTLQSFYFSQINFQAHIESLSETLATENLKNEELNKHVQTIYLLLMNLAIYEVENQVARFHFVRLYFFNKFTFISLE